MSHNGRWSSVTWVDDHYERGGKRVNTREFLGLGGIPGTVKQCDMRREKKPKNIAHKKTS